MVKRIIIANAIGCLGIVGSTAFGIAMVFAALDHNPQRIYTENPEYLFPIFYSWAAVLSLPFLILRQVLLYQNKFLWFGLLFSFCIATYFIDISDYEPKNQLLFLLGSTYFPFHIFDLIKNRKQKLTDPSTNP